MFSTHLARGGPEPGPGRASAGGWARAGQGARAGGISPARGGSPRLPDPGPTPARAPAPARRRRGYVYAGGCAPGGVARWLTWVFELSVPADEFSRALQRALVVRGLQVDPAQHFDFVARGFGARAYVAVAWAEGGLQLTAKLKSGLFASPAALERLLLEAGRETQAKLVFTPGDTIL